MPTECMRGAQILIYCHLSGYVITFLKCFVLAVNSMEIKSNTAPFLLFTRKQNPHTICFIWLNLRILRHMKIVLSFAILQLQELHCD